MRASHISSMHSRLHQKLGFNTRVPFRCHFSNCPKSRLPPFRFFLDSKESGSLTLGIVGGLPCTKYVSLTHHVTVFGFPEKGPMRHLCCEMVRGGAGAADPLAGSVPRSRRRPRGGAAGSLAGGRGLGFGVPFGPAVYFHTKKIRGGFSLESTTTI